MKLGINIAPFETSHSGPVCRRSAKKSINKNMNIVLEILMQNDSIYVHDYN
jgi:hypothetical protein